MQTCSTTGLRYRICWISAVALLVVIVVGFVLLRPTVPVAPEDVRSAVREENPPPQTIKQRTGALSADLEDLEFSLSSSDGALRMRLWAQAARKKGSRYEITNGALQFTTESKNTLLLQVEDAVYIQEDDVARIAGSIVGHITGSEQYFDARRVEWNMTGNTLVAEAVTFRSPAIKVTGESMFINLLTGEIRFDGPVTAGI